MGRVKERTYTRQFVFFGSQKLSSNFTYKSFLLVLSDPSNWKCQRLNLWLCNLHALPLSSRNTRSKLSCTHIYLFHFLGRSRISVNINRSWIRSPDSDSCAKYETQVWKWCRISYFKNLQSNIYSQVPARSRAYFQVSVRRVLAFVPPAVNMAKFV